MTRDPWRPLTAAQREAVRGMRLGTDPLTLADPDVEPHWACLDCGMPCRCTGPIRALPHQPCGLWEP